MSLLPPASKMSDLRADEVHLEATKAGDGAAALTMTLRGRPGDEIEKLCIQHQDKGYVTYVLDDAALIRLMRMAAGIVAEKQLAEATRLVQPVVSMR